MEPGLDLQSVLPEDSKRRAAEAGLAAYLLFRRRERSTAKALLLAEKRTLRALRLAIGGVTAQAIAQAARTAQTTDSAHRIVSTLAPTMQSVVQAAIAEQRRHARHDARAGLVRQLGRAGIHVTPPDRMVPLDDASAQSAASSYASAWTRHVVLSSEQIDQGPYRTIAARYDQAEEATLPNLSRIAATETAHAFNNERADILESEAVAPQIIRVWSAMMDGRTCRRCANLDGQTYPRIGPLPEYPPLHPRCRCSIDFLIVPADQDPEAVYRDVMDRVRANRTWN